MSGSKPARQAQRPNDLMGLTDDEYDLVVEIMGRVPNQVELGIFSVMWSEHCSYKSSKKWLKQLPNHSFHYFRNY